MNDTIPIVILLLCVVIAFFYERSRALNVALVPPILTEKNHAVKSTEPTYYPRNDSDAYQVAFLLRQVLIPDLAPQILEHAGYWVKSTDSRDERIVIRQESTGYVYLVTKPIKTKMVHPVRKLVFTVSSRDQGWSNFSKQHGTYDNSWTWFQASKTRIPHYDYADTRFSEDPDSPDWARLFSNIHAGKRLKTHTVKWSRDSADGDVQDFVRNLKNGDMLQLTVWASFPGWENRVQSAQIDVYTACVR